MKHARRRNTNYDLPTVKHTTTISAFQSQILQVNSCQLSLKRPHKGLPARTSPRRRLLAAFSHTYTRTHRDTQTATNQQCPSQTVARVLVITGYSPNGRADGPHRGPPPTCCYPNLPAPSGGSRTVARAATQSGPSPDTEHHSPVQAPAARASETHG